MPQKQHIIHGRDHLPRGADPIPGLLAGSASGGDWVATILTLPDLVGYWRLGEGSSPYADTSGHPDGPADMERAVFGVAMTQDVTPGLLPEDQDDGAVAFNKVGADGDDTVSDFLRTPNSRFAFDTGDGPFTVIARIKPYASAASFYGHIAGTLVEVSGGPNWDGGWSLRLRWPTMLVSLARGSNAATFHAAESTGISAGTEYTVAGTYDTTTIRVYINGTLADSEADIGILPITPLLQIGGTGSVNGWQPFYGVIDEVAVYGQALTAAQIATLHTAAVTPAVAEAGWVATADGAGGITWAAPTIEVEF